MIALYLALRNVCLVLLAIPCVIVCEICFCPPVCLFVVLLPFYTSTCTAFMRINFFINHAKSPATTALYLLVSYTFVDFVSVNRRSTQADHTSKSTRENSTVDSKA